MSKYVFIILLLASGLCAAPGGVGMPEHVGWTTDGHTGWVKSTDSIFVNSVEAELGDIVPTKTLRGVHLRGSKW